MKIGIPVSQSKTQFYVNQAYIAYLQEAGFEPVMISILNNVEDYTDFCDALLLPGGIDLDPIFYGEDNIASYKVEPKKDDFERQLFHAFILAGKRIFGICRGFQLIIREYLRVNPGLERWLRYWQHINNHEQTGTLTLDRDVPCHQVTIIPSGLYGTGGNAIGNMYVNSMHHQAILATPPKKHANAVKFGGLLVVATSRYGMKDKDEGYIVEGIRLQWQNSQILAVQWHPEELRDLPLIVNFFNQGDAVITAGE